MNRLERQSHKNQQWHEKCCRFLLETLGIPHRNPLDFVPVSVWLNSNAHTVLNCTVAQTAVPRHCHSGPGGVCALAPLSRLEGNCFSAPRLFMFCDWIIRPRAREATFVARLGCFSALPLSWLFQQGSVAASQSSRWYWHILYSVYPTVKKTDCFLLKLISHQRHLSPVYLFLLKPINFFSLTLLAFKNTAESSVSVLMGFFKWFIRLWFSSAQVLIGFWKKICKNISHSVITNCVTLRWTVSISFPEF